MQQKKPKNKLLPKTIKINIYWVPDEEGNVILDEDATFDEYSNKMAELVEKYTEINEIEFEDEVGEGGGC
jgi:hypothetical protein